jgi:hypothetical protein
MSINRVEKDAADRASPPDGYPDEVSERVGERRTVRAVSCSAAAEVWRTAA